MSLSTGSAVVTPGPPIQILAQMEAGTLLVNNDGANGVWVSDGNAVSPGIGFFIGPFGSITWTATGPCFACVDTGVLTPVSLSVGSAATNPDNPVSVGVAVAQKLLATGVPNVLVSTLVGDFSLLLLGQTALLDVHMYASLQVAFKSTPPPNSGALYFQWFDSLGNLIVNDVVTIVADSIIVKGPFVRISNLSSTIATRFFLTGINEQYESYSDSWQAPLQFDTGVIAMANNTTYPLNPQIGIGLATQNMQGAIFASFVTGSTVSGQFWLMSNYGDNNAVLTRLCDTNEMIVGTTGAKVFTKTIALPGVPWVLQFRSQAVAAAGQALVSLVKM